MLKAAEDIHLLILLAQFPYLREHVVACFNGIAYGVTTYISVVVRVTILILVVGPVSLIVCRDSVSVSEVRIVHVTTYYPVPTVEGEVECYDSQCTRNILILAARCAQSVTEGVAVIATESDAQPFD